ncbi:hypothetical protein ES703_43002 [subsurface metagenome]
MGAIFRWLKRLYNLLIKAVDIRYLTLPANAAAVTVTGDATANTKGVYAEIDDGSGITVESQIVGVHITPGAADIYHVDIAKGDVASEVVLLTDIPVERDDQGAAASHAFSMPIWLPTPVEIPAGTRLSARLASVGGASATATVAVILKQGY